MRIKIQLGYSTCLITEVLSTTELVTILEALGKSTLYDTDYSDNVKNVKADQTPRFKILNDSDPGAVLDTIEDYAKQIKKLHEEKSAILSIKNLLSKKFEAQEKEIENLRSVLAVFHNAENAKEREK